MNERQLKHLCLNKTQSLRSNKLGQFIVIEGLDGAGKSTAIKFVREFFDIKKYETVYTREPGGTKIAEELRSLILENKYDESIHPDSELLIIYAGRVQHCRNFILPALKRGINVISDRFYWSSMAYQGGGRGVNLSKLENLNNDFIYNCMPNLVIYLDIDPLVGLKRAKEVDCPDRIERSGLEFFEKARHTFKLLVKKSNNAIEINASLPLEYIRKEIHHILYRHFQVLNS